MKRWGGCTTGIGAVVAELGTGFCLSVLVLHLSGEPA